MDDEVREALASCQAELRLLDTRLAEADGEADPLAIATTFVALDKIKRQVTKLAGALKPPPRSPDPGPTLPGMSGGDDDQGGADHGGKGRRRR